MPNNGSQTEMPVLFVESELTFREPLKISSQY